MTKTISSLFSLSALALVLAVPAYSQEAAKAPEAQVAAPVDASKSESEAKLDAAIKQNEALQKQLDEMKAAKAQPAEAPAPAAPAFEAVGGLVGTVHQTTTTWIYGDAQLGELEPASQKSFTVKDLNLSLAKLYENTKSLPKGKPYGFKLQGFMKVTEAGNHGISVGLTSDVPAKGATIGTMSYTWDKCSSFVVLGEGEDSRKIGDIGQLGRERYTPQIHSVADTKIVDLEPGTYRFEATVNCAGPAYDPAFKSAWAIKVQQPSDFEPVAPPQGMFFYKRKVGTGS